MTTICMSFVAAKMQIESEDKKDDDYNLRENCFQVILDSDDIFRQFSHWHRNFLESPSKS